MAHLPAADDTDAAFPDLVAVRARPTGDLPAAVHAVSEAGARADRRAHLRRRVPDLRAGPARGDVPLRWPVHRLRAAGGPARGRHRTGPGDPDQPTGVAARARAARGRLVS